MKLFKSSKSKGSSGQAAAEEAAAAPAGGAAVAEGGSGKPVREVRRRLSVMGGGGVDEALLEGVEGMDLAGGGRVNRRASVNTRVEITNATITQVHGLSKKGYAPYNPRKQNQDVCIIERDTVTDSMFLCVMDGHGEVGHHVTRHIKKQLAERLFSHPAWAEDPNLALAETLNAIETELNSRQDIDTQFSGTTYTSCTIRNGVIHCANCGDSRITLASRRDGRFVARALTLDHKPDLPEEQARIEATGGRVFAVKYDDGIDGPPRVWLGHLDVPGLAMSRSLGDMVAHEAGVSSEPEFSQHVLTDDDAFLILASDGLWEFMSDQECVDLATDQETCVNAVDVLVKEANARWMKEEQVIDDTTVVVGYLSGFNSGS